MRIVASYAQKIQAGLERNVFPWIGTIPVHALTSPQLLGVVRRMEARGVLESAHRTLGHCNRILRYAVATGRGCYVFPSARTPTRPMSDNALLSALRCLGIPKDMMTGHGFRAMARTLLDEVLGFRPDFIEHQLAHAVRDPNGRAYNRTAHLQERRDMMQAWADYLEQLKLKGAV